MPPLLSRSQRALFFAVVFILIARFSDADESDASWLVRVWKTSDGLAGNYVSGVVETPDGFLWTVAGGELARFDGATLKRFPTADFAESTAKKIREFTQLRDGSFVFALDDGSIVRVKSGTLEKLSPALPPEKPHIESICENPEGGVLLSYRDDSVSWLHNGQVTYFTTADGLPPGTHCRFVTDRENQVWFSKGRDVGRLHGRRFESLKQFSSGGGPRIAAARAGGVWIAAGSQLFRLKSEKAEPEEIGRLPEGIPSRPSVLLEDHRGAVWIGTSASGLFRCEDGRSTSVPVSHRFIVSLTEDREGSLWVCTSGGGLNQVQPRTLTIEGDETGLPAEAVQALCEDSNRRLWGISQNGLLVARTSEGTWKKALPEDVNLRGQVSCIAADTTGALWIGMKNRQLHCWRNNHFTTWGANEGIVSTSIRTLLVARSGDLWIGASNPGMVQRIHDGRLFTFQLPAKKIDVIRTMTEDTAGNIWIASVPRGLFRITREDQVIDESSRTAGIPGAIRTLQATDDGSLWIGFDHDGIARVKGDSIGRITTAQGLPDDGIEMLLPDNRGWLWLAANQMFFKVSTDNVDAVIAGRAARVETVQYGNEQGLRPVFGETVGALRRSDGRLWIPTATNLVIVNPDGPPLDPTPPPVFITEARVDDQVVIGANCDPMPAPKGAKPMSTALRLPPAHRRLDLDFTALSFRMPANVRFRYQLENFDDRWIEGGAKRTVSYSRLAAGNYRFHVRARNGDGVWNDVGGTLALIVEPFFWQTWWFRVAAVAAFTSLVFAVTRTISVRRFREKLRMAEQETALERERTRIARDIHDDLGGRLTKIVLLSGLVMRDRAAPEKAGQRVEEISDTARQLIKSLDETVWTVNPRNDTFPHLIAYIGQYAVNFLRTAEIECEVDLPDSPPPTHVSAEVRHHLLLAIKESLTNVVRHARATRVKLHVAADADRFRIVVEDNGEGFEPGAGAAGADGLENIAQRLKQIGGTFAVESRRGSGTRLAFTVPWSQR